MNNALRNLFLFLTFLFLFGWAIVALALPAFAADIKELPPLYGIQRTSVELGSGNDLVLLHKKHFTHPKDRLYQFPSLAAFLEAGEGRLLCEGGESGNPWCRNGTKPDSGFNCHAHAVGDLIGLTPDDWLDGGVSKLTGNTNPMQVVLDNFFREVASNDLREGDVVSLVKNGPDGVEYIHSGRIVNENGRVMIASKLGEGPLVVALLSVYEKEYEGLFDTIKVFRQKGSQRIPPFTRKMPGPLFVVLWVYRDEVQPLASVRSSEPGWVSLAVFHDKETCLTSKKNLEAINDIVGGDTQAICLPAGVELPVQQ